jgi:hypothetical protein
MRWLVLNQRVLAVSGRDALQYLYMHLRASHRKINQNNSKNEKRTTYIFTALMFYTRIPCPATIDQSRLFKASRYFPLGWIVGSAAFVVFMFFNFLVGPDIAVLFSMIASVLVTRLFTKMVLLMFVMVLVAVGPKKKS